LLAAIRERGDRDRDARPVGGSGPGDDVDVVAGLPGTQLELAEVRPRRAGLGRRGARSDPERASPKPGSVRVRRGGLEARLEADRREDEARIGLAQAFVGRLLRGPEGPAEG